MSSVLSVGGHSRRLDGSRDRGDEFDDLDAEVRGWFTGAGFTETAHDTLERGSRQTVGAVRVDGPAVPLVPDTRMFAFVR